MKRLIICAILVLALSTQAYGWGHRGGDAPRQSAVYNGGSSAAGGDSAGNGVTAQNSNNPGNPVSVPEPATLLLLGAGLGVIIGFRKKLKKG
jgi:hypothetical protein